MPKHWLPTTTYSIAGCLQSHDPRRLSAQRSATSEQDESPLPRNFHLNDVNLTEQLVSPFFCPSSSSRRSSSLPRGLVSHPHGPSSRLSGPAFVCPSWPRLSRATRGPISVRPSWPHSHASLVDPFSCIPHGPIIVHPPHGLSSRALFKVSVLRPLGRFFCARFLAVL